MAWTQLPADGTTSTAVSLRSSAERGFLGVMSALQEGLPVSMHVYGDSTSDGSTEWAYMLSEWMATQYPEFTAKYRVWNASDYFDRPTVHQIGTDGEKHAVFTGVKSALISAGGIPTITGDLDIRLKILADDWTPSASQALIARYGTATHLAFVIFLESTTKIRYVWSSTGSDFLFATSTVAATVVDGTPTWIRVAHDVDNGAAGNTVTFYTSSDGDTWTQLGAPVTAAGTTNIYSGSGLDAQPYEIGARTWSQSPFIGKIYQVEILSGIDGYIMNPLNIDAWVPQDTSCTFTGAPDFAFVNCSKSGANLAYYDATRLAKMHYPFSSLSLASVISLSHNEALVYGASKMANYATLIASILSTCPMDQIVLLTQNPVTSVYDKEQAYRRAELLSWGSLNGRVVIDTYSDFLPDPLPYLNSDGVHPNLAGETLMFNRLRDSVLNSTP